MGGGEQPASRERCSLLRQRRMSWPIHFFVVAVRSTSKGVGVLSSQACGVCVSRLLVSIMNDWVQGTIGLSDEFYCHVFSTGIGTEDGVFWKIKLSRAAASCSSREGSDMASAHTQWDF